MLQDFYKKVEEVFSVLSLVEEQEKYMYIMDIGKKLKPEEDIKNETYIIKDCASAAFIKVYIADNKIKVIVDSDSLLVKGLLYLLKKSFDNEEIDTIKDFNIQEVVNRTGLNSHITNQRMIGFGGALREIQKRITMEKTQWQKL